MKIGEKISIESTIGHKKIKGTYIVKEEYNKFFLMKKISGKEEYLECFMKYKFKNGDLKVI